MQECCPCGSVRGALGNQRPYRDTWTVSRTYQDLRLPLLHKRRTPQSARGPQGAKGVGYGNVEWHRESHLVIAAVVCSASPPEVVGQWARVG